MAPPAERTSNDDTQLRPAKGAPVAGSASGPRPHAARQQPHHLVGLHGQLHLVVAVLLAAAVGALDPLQMRHALLRGQRPHRGDVLRGQRVDLGFLI